MEIQFYGSNCVRIGNKKVSILVDDDLEKHGRGLGHRGYQSAQGLHGGHEPPRAGAGFYRQRAAPLCHHGAGPGRVHPRRKVGADHGLDPRPGTKTAAVRAFFGRARVYYDRE